MSRSGGAQTALRSGLPRIAALDRRALPGRLWLVLNPRARRSRTIRSTLETTTVLTVPAKMEVCKEPDHVGLGHLVASR